MAERASEIRLGRLVAELEADVSRFERDFEHLGKTIETFEFVSLKGLSKAFGAVAAAAGVAFGFMSGFVLKVGGDVQAVSRRFDDTFGAGSARMRQFVDDFATMAGVSKRAAKAGIADMGALASAWGASADQAERLSEKAFRVAADLAAFRGLPTEKVFVSIRAAMNGMLDDLGPLGLSISDSVVKLRAMADTGKDSADDLTKLDEAIATLNEITRQAGPAMGALARNQDDAAIAGRSLFAEINNIKDDLAEDLLPIVRELIPLFRDWAGAVGSVVEGVADLTLKVSDFLGITTQVGRVGANIIGRLVDKGQLEALKESFQASATAAQELIDAAVPPTVANRARALGDPEFAKRLTSRADFKKLQGDLRGFEQLVTQIEQRLANLPKAGLGRTVEPLKAIVSPEFNTELGKTIQGIESLFTNGQIWTRVQEESMTVLQDWVGRLQEGQQVFEDSLNPIQAAAFAIEELKRQLAEGTITAGTFWREFKNIVEGLEEAEKQAIDWGREIKQQLFSIGFSAGRDLIFGLIDGSKSLGDTLKRTLSRLVESAIFLGFKFLLFGSPSKLMMQFGRDTISGYIMGLNEMQGQLATAASTLAMVPAAAGAGAAAVAGPRITPDFSGIPGPVTPREVARDQAWQEVFQETAREVENSGFRFGGE